VQAVGEIPEVRSAFLLTGRWDVVVHVVARDMAHLKDLALDKFTNQPGVTRIETAIVYDAKRRHEVPLIQGTEQ
jgi:DNA-binding Lrp family transcriptional regulator